MMRLLIVYDNEIIDGMDGVRSEWGFSALIDNGKEKVLFDTGGDGKILLGNMKALGVDPSSLDHVVISHEHWDHNGGLDDLIPLLSNCTLHDSSDRELSGTIEHHKVSGPYEVSEGILSTGYLDGDPLPEQSLILEGNMNRTVLAGCSHPGVGRILQAAGGSISGIIGGFHGFDDLDLFLQMDMICPLHCTVRKDDILERFGKKAIKGGIGLQLEL